MAYTSGTLDNLFGGPVEGTAKIWVYRTTDTLLQVLASNYITDVNSTTTGGLPTGNKHAMSVGDIVLVTNQSATVATQYTAYCLVSAIGTSGATLVLYLPPAAGGNEPRNMLHGGDATTNPWQRGTAISGIVATNTYTADRWFVVAGAATSANVTKTAATDVTGFSQNFTLTRQSGQSSVSAIVMGQVLETVNSVRAQGQPVAFSFWAKANSGYTGGNLGVRVGMGTGTDQSASSFVNTSWTGYSDVISTTQALTATATRYVFTGTVPTSATQLGVSLQFTPAGTNTGNDGISFYGLQLEVAPNATPFEHRDQEIETALCQRYFWQQTEVGTSSIINVGATYGVNSTQFVFQLPVPMRAAPTVTVVAGSFAQMQSGVAIAVSGFANISATTVNQISVVSTATATQGLATLLIGRQANSGNIAASADL